MAYGIGDNDVCSCLWLVLGMFEDYGKAAVHG